MGLNEQQKYLMGRLPNLWDMKDFDDEPEPPDVTSAKKLIAAFDARQSKRRKKSEAEAKAALNKAREAIHFLPPERALIVVKELEKKFLGKKV